jgi:hypothetical protein
MANTVNVSTTGNTITITPPQNTSVSIGSTSTSTTVTQGSISVVQVASQGPQGPVGAPPNPPILFKLTKENDDGNKVIAEGVVNVALGGAASGEYISISTSSFNGVNLARSGIADNYFQDIGSQITLISTSSGKFLRAKARTYTTPDNNTLKYLTADHTWQTSSAGIPDVGDIVELRWDNSAQIGSAKPFGGWVDPTSTQIDIQIKSSSFFYPALPGYGTNSEVNFRDTLYIAASISKSLDLTVNSLNTTTHITASGNISASGNIYANDLILDYDSLPSSNPTNKGQIYRDDSGQLFISAG